MLVGAGFAAAPPIAFEEVARKAGLLFVLKNAESGQFHQIELMGGGVAALDYNNDGCADIFFTNGAAIPSLKKTGPEFYNRLYRNNCDMTFTDVTSEAGLQGEGYSMAVAVGDFDNDGFADIFVAGVDRNILYRNLGNGKFLDVTLKSGVSGDKPKPWSVSSGWVDYDNDGWLDLFVTNYVAWDPSREPKCGNPDQRFYCHPNQYKGLANQLFHNNHDGTFTDVSAKSGVGAHIGKGMGVAFADMDGDGFMDIFVANDSVRGFLFHNQGNGTFKEVGLETGVALRDDGAAIAGMGADWRDFDNDGRPDIVVSGMINDGFLLFRNRGAKRGFDDHSERSGLLIGTRQLTGWGLGMYDFDNDGWKDLFFANAHFTQLGHFLGRDAALPNRVFRNQGNGRFVDVEALSGAALHRGVAFADFDNDGRVDAVVTAMNGPAKLYRNVSGGAAHWLAVKLRGVKSNRQGLGAEVRVVLEDGRSLYNHATTTVGYGSSSEVVVRFGLGTQSAVQRLEVHWPGRKTQTVKIAAVDNMVEVVEEP